MNFSFQLFYFSTPDFGGWAVQRPFLVLFSLLIFPFYSGIVSLLCPQVFDNSAIWFSSGTVSVDFTIFFSYERRLFFLYLCMPYNFFVTENTLFNLYHAVILDGRFSSMKSVFFLFVCLFFC